MTSLGRRVRDLEKQVEEILEIVSRKEEKEKETVLDEILRRLSDIEDELDDSDPSDDSVLEDEDEDEVTVHPWVIKDPCPKGAKGRDQYYNAEDDSDPWTGDIDEAEGYRTKKQAEREAMHLHHEGDVHFQSTKKRLVVEKRQHPFAS